MTYELQFTSGTTVWYPETVTHTIVNPYIWNVPLHAQKCVNCGYCSCCGKSDIPGKLAEE